MSTISVHGLKQRLADEIAFIDESTDVIEEYAADRCGNIRQLLEDALNYIDRMEKGVKGNVGKSEAA
jgi:hypothetical protein